VRGKKAAVPQNMTGDDDSEFCSRALEAWAMANEVQLCLSCPTAWWRMDSSRVQRGASTIGAFLRQSGCAVWFAPLEIVPSAYHALAVG
jgi:hypothetical protein